jgi:acetolactate synthase I/III small subunit
MQGGVYSHLLWFVSLRVGFLLSKIGGGIMNKHVLSVLVKNYSGVLSRVTGLFSRRGYNIESLSVGKTEDPRLSRITIELMGDDYVLDQFKKQLNKLHDVEKVIELKPEASVYRELVLIKVNASAEKRASINEIVEIFRCKVIDISLDTLTIELTGDESKTSALIGLMQQYGIKEIVRTGLTALERGSKDINSYDKYFEEFST